jgi:hypothetical protein
LRGFERSHPQLVCVLIREMGSEAPRLAATPHSCQGAEILCPLRAISKMHQAKFYCITRCVALKRTRATFPCAAPRHDSSPSRCAARADLAEISRRTRAVIF